MAVQKLINRTQDVQAKTVRGATLPDYGWTDTWFTRTFLTWLPTRESPQAAEALRHFAAWERAGQRGRSGRDCGQPQPERRRPV